MWLPFRRRTGYHNFSWLIAQESYLGHSLSPTEMSSILYYYDSLHFNFELIEYLIEYCISRGTKAFIA